MSPVVCSCRAAFKTACFLLMFHSRMKWSHLSCQGPMMTACQHSAQHTLLGQSMDTGLGEWGTVVCPNQCCLTFSAARLPSSICGCHIRALCSAAQQHHVSSCSDHCQLSPEVEWPKKLLFVVVDLIYSRVSFPMGRICTTSRNKLDGGVV